MPWLLALVPQPLLHATRGVLNVLPVLGVTALFLWSYYAFVLQWVPALLANGHMAKGIINTTLYHILATLCMWSYYTCVLSRPPLRLVQAGYLHLIVMTAGIFR